MSWSENARTPARALAALILLAGLGAGLAGCGFTPVYGDDARAVASQIELAFARPSTRLQQIVYQHLSLRLGESDDPAAPLLTVDISQSSRSVGHTSSGTPLSQKEVLLTGNVSVVRFTPEPETLFTGSRTAAATYEEGSQLLANSFALTDAEERAARALAESIRLMLIAGLDGRL